MAKLLIGGMNATKGGFFSWLQRVVTGHKATHSFIILSNSTSKSLSPKWTKKQWMLDARLSITLDDWEKVKANKDHEYWLFSIQLSQEHLDNIETWALDTFINKTYGILGLPWFLWRRINELVGRDIRSKPRFFTFVTKGTVCSEMNWYILDRVSMLTMLHYIHDMIKPWLPDNFHSGDNKGVLYYLAKWGGHLGIKLEEERFINLNKK